MNKPAVQFIGIGGMGSGSDFVYTYLHEHPATCIPKQATHFFSDSERHARGLEWYNAHFSSCRSAAMKGEAADDYLSSPGVAQRIAETCPGAKLIAVVCNPLERLYTEYARAKEAHTIEADLTFSQYIELYPESLERGLFGKHLREYFDLYSPVQLYVLVHEDRYAHPVKYIQSVYTFLEIDDSFVPKLLRPFTDIDVDDKAPSAWYIKLIHLVLFPIWLFRINRLVMWGWSKVRSLLRRVLTPPAKHGKQSKPTGPKPLPIAAELKMALVDYYAADVRVLSGLLYRDLNSEWDIHESVR